MWVLEKASERLGLGIPGKGLGQLKRDDIVMELQEPNPFGDAQVTLGGKGGRMFKFPEGASTLYITPRDQRNTEHHQDC